MSRRDSIHAAIILAIILISFICISGCINQSSLPPQGNVSISPKPTLPSEISPPNVSSIQPVSVDIKDFAFSPVTITIPLGTTVTWTNNDSVPHTVTSTTGIFDSGIMGQGKNFVYTFNESGTFEYYCAIHPYMKAQIIVTSAGSQHFNAHPTTVNENQTEIKMAPVASTGPISFEGRTISPISTTSPQPSTRITVDLLAKDMSFDRDNITVIAGAQVNINLYNLDRGVPHNFAVYANPSADTVIFQGQVVIGPGMITYTFNAPADPAIYFFRCDVHPKVMTGQFIVLPSGGVQSFALQSTVAPHIQPNMNMSRMGVSEVNGAIPKMTSTNASHASTQNVTIDLIAQDIAFDRKTITVPSRAHVTLIFNNKDSGVPHNFAVYESSEAENAIFRGQIVVGLKMITYTFDAPAKPGTYLFRCDVHPIQMTGQFIVE